MGAAESDRDAVVLAEARTPYERQAIAAWAESAHPGVPVQDLSDLADLPQLADPARSGSTRLIPARVVWLPPVRNGRRRVSMADVLALTNPRRPRAGAQARIARRSPDRVRVVAGEPATLNRLRERYESSAAEGTPFADWVALQASLSGERAERSIIGDRYKVPRLVAEQISSSARFREGAAALAAQLGRPEAQVVQEATDKMSTFVATQSRLMDDVFSSMLSLMHERTWTVSVDLATLDRLRVLNRSHALVFLPSHRSYVDPLVLAEVLREHDFPPNHVLGGNNLQLWPLSTIARRSGMIFIRRRFGDDPLYKFAMRSYLAHLVEKRFNLEWYIEGGRSRTGKLRKPMLGLLSYVVAAAEQIPDADVMVVPTSIVYDQLHEISAMAAESAGGTKKAENLGWLVGYVNAQRKIHLGAARVRFGEPFSLREALAEAGEGPARLEKVAFRVMDGINAATPISATSLATFALLGAEERAFTEREIEQILDPLLGYIAQRGLPGPDPALLRGLGLRRTLGELTRAGVLSHYDGGSEPVWSVAAGNHAIAAYYRNGALHHLVNRAIVELSMLAAARGSLVAEKGEEAEALLAASQAEALRIRDLLKFEFFFPPREPFLSLLGAELDLLAPEWRKVVPNSEWARETLRAHAGSLVARRTLQSFLDAQLVVAQRLVAAGEDWPGRDAFLHSCLGNGRQMALQGRVTSDSVSRELYAAAVELAANRSLVEPGSPDLVAGRAAFLAEVQELRGRLAQLAAIEEEVRG
jgi:glycerol-3-phosphate O-acyltransferase